MPAKINAAFWEWFGDSVVKNDDGTPMVVYHGTTDEFDAFDTDGSHIGSHFSSSLGPASYYSSRKTNGGRLIAAYLRIERPWVCRDLGRWDDMAVAKEWARQEGSPDWNTINVWLPILEEIRSFGPHWSKRQENHMIKAWLKSKGYDGIYYLNRYESGSGDKSASAWSDRAMSHTLSDEEFQRKFPEASWDWIAFYPWQIKSLKNDGTWDLDDPRYGSNPASKYHVTTAASAKKIAKKGILPLQPSNWVKGSGERYGEGEIFAFNHPLDAMRWAAHMDYNLHERMGTGKIVIVEFVDDGPWEIDTGDPISQIGRKGNWLKKFGSVEPEQITSITPVTKAHIRRVVNSNPPGESHASW